MADCSTLTAVLGDPVSHSRSPRMHNAAFRALGLDWLYLPLHVRPPQLEAALRGLAALGFAGANVTIPHKERTAALVDELSPAARAIGAVNTVIVRGDRLFGDNTDAPGLLAALAEAGVTVERMHTVVLGAGGAARGAVYALASTGASVAVANRTVERAEALVRDLQPHVAGRLSVLPLADANQLRAHLDHAGVLVNTTSVGMAPRDQDSPLPAGIDLYAALTVLDMVYAPRRTVLLQQAAAAGCRTVEGLRLLLHQGALSFQMWTGRQAPLAVMEQALEE